MGWKLEQVTVCLSKSCTVGLLKLTESERSRSARVVQSGKTRVFNTETFSKLAKESVLWTVCAV